MLDSNNLSKYRKGRVANVFKMLNMAWSIRSARAKSKY